MIAAGIEVQSFLNPYGKNWKVKSDNPYYWFCKWIRHRMGVDVVPNQIFYKYHPTHCHININTDSKITKYKTIEEVIKADNLAFDAKLNIFDSMILLLWIGILMLRVNVNVLKQ